MWAPRPLDIVPSYSRRGVATVLTWVAFCAMVLLVVLNHEAWRDEADVWLAARDMTPLQLFHWLHYAGTPGLWHYLVMIPAKLGLPFAAMGVMHGMIAMAVAGLILWRAPFPWWLRCLLVFSYFIAYEYAVIARSYVLTELFLVLVAITYEKRFQHPIRMGLWLALMANTNIHGGIFAGVFFLVITGEYLLRQRGRTWDVPVHPSRGVLLVGMMLAVIGGLVAVAQVVPTPPDGQLSTFLTLKYFWGVDYLMARTYTPGMPHQYELLLNTLYNHAWLAAIVHYGMRIVGVAAFLATLYLLRHHRRMLFVFLLSLSGLIYIFLFKWMGNEHHSGLVWLLAFTVLWIARCDRELHSSSNPWGWPDRLAGMLLVATVAVSVFTCVVRLGMDWRWAYSGAPETARFLIDNDIAGQRIAVFSDTKAGPILPYLPGQKFWYAGRQAYGTFMPWRHEWVANQELSNEEVLRRVARAFPDDKPLYLILNDPITDAREAGYTLLFRDQRPEMPGSADEHYYVYQRIGRPVEAALQ